MRKPKESKKASKAKSTKVKSTKGKPTKAKPTKVKPTKVKPTKVRSKNAKATKRKAAKPPAKKAKRAKATKQTKPRVSQSRRAAVAAAPASSLDDRRAAARAIFANLVRESQMISPAGSPQHANATSLGFSRHIDRGETDERHRTGMQFVRLSQDIILAFGRAERALSDGKGRGDSPNASAWYSDVEPILRRGCEKFQQDRFVGILELVDSVYSLAESRYGQIPLAVALSLTRASVMAYGYGFFVRYNARRMGARVN